MTSNLGVENKVNLRVEKKIELGCRINNPKVLVNDMWERHGVMKGKYLFYLVWGKPEQNKKSGYLMSN